MEARMLRNLTLVFAVVRKGGPVRITGRDSLLSRMQQRNSITLLETEI
jgi:hypothetical protein